MSELLIGSSSSRRVLLSVFFILVFTALIWAALMIPSLIELSSPSLAAGQVSSQDILSPRSLSYESKILTEQKREAAARSVSPVYTAPDTSVARQQVERLRATLAYITSVRADSFASAEQKRQDLAALEDVRLRDETVTRLLALSDSRWQTVQQEAIVVLEQVMRSTIRADRLEDSRRSTPALVSLALPESQADIVAELAALFVAPNSLFSEDLTEEARTQARQAVEPISRTFVSGETIVRRGQVLDEDDIEALQQFGLARPTTSWQEPTSAAILSVLIVAFMLFYRQRSRDLAHRLRTPGIIALLFLAFLISARLVVPGHTVIPYAFPLAAYGLVVAVLFGPEAALVSSLPLAIAAAYGLANALELSLFYMMGSFFGILALGRARRISAFFGASLALSIASLAVVVVFRLPLATTDWIGLATLGGASLFNGLAAASLTILLQFFLAQLLGMTTPMQLMDLARPDHPLLQMILREAPGTYQHSLQVANLAEQAAERIGADPLLTRVGALYHDAGKALNPVFFIENQLPGFINPHNDLDPATSAQTIIRHVTEGLVLARKSRLPRRIIEFISEHHGTMLTRYQYVHAVAAAGGDESQVDASLFRYPGPRPQSRETAILMLADGCEARVRAELPKGEEDLRKIVKSVIDTRVENGQLGDTDLTLRDLDQILESFVATLRGIYHPRIQYPKMETSPQSELTVPVSYPNRRTADLQVGSSVDTPTLP